MGSSNLSDLSLSNNSLVAIPADLATAPRLKCLRIEEVQALLAPARVRIASPVLPTPLAPTPSTQNKITTDGIPEAVLRDSQISLLSLQGNPVDVKELRALPGYAAYGERYTLAKKKQG